MELKKSLRQRLFGDNTAFSKMNIGRTFVTCDFSNVADNSPFATFEMDNNTWRRFEYKYKNPMDRRFLAIFRHTERTIDDEIIEAMRYNRDFEIAFPGKHTSGKILPVVEMASIVQVLCRDRIDHAFAYEYLTYEGEGGELKVEYDFYFNNNPNEYISVFANAETPTEWFEIFRNEFVEIKYTNWESYVQAMISKAKEYGTEYGIYLGNVQKFFDKDITSYEDSKF